MLRGFQSLLLPTTFTHHIKQFALKDLESVITFHCVLTKKMSNLFCFCMIVWIIYSYTLQKSGWWVHHCPLTSVQALFKRFLMSFLQIMLGNLIIISIEINNYEVGLHPNESLWIFLYFKVPPLFFFFFFFWVITCLICLIRVDKCLSGYAGYLFMEVTKLFNMDLILCLRILVSLDYTSRWFVNMCYVL